MVKIKKINYIIFLIVIIVLASYFILTQVRSVHGNGIKTIKISNNDFRVEVVSTIEKMETGLGGRNDLCSNCGMLFKFNDTGRYSFWMKDMKFPLDIIWISKDKIVYIEKNILPTFIGKIAPLEDADMVLEINAGISEGLGIKIGDRVSF